MRSTRTPLRALAAATLLALTACGGGDGGGDAGGGGGDADAPRIAAVFSGVTTDADYTFLGLEALQAAEADFGAETTYSESVPSPTPSGCSGSTWPTGTTSSGRTAASSTTPR